MAVSIKDGSWSEQRARLLSSGHKSFYILEGNFRNVEVLPYGSLVGANTNISVLEGVEVFRTLNIQETKFILIMLAKKCQTFTTLDATQCINKAAFAIVIYRRVSTHAANIRGPNKYSCPWMLALQIDRQSMRPRALRNGNGSFTVPFVWHAELW